MLCRPQAPGAEDRQELGALRFAPQPRRPVQQPVGFSSCVFALPAAEQCCCLGEYSSSGAFLSWQILIIQQDSSRLENPEALQLPVL